MSRSSIDPDGRESFRHKKVHHKRWGCCAAVLCCFIIGAVLWPAVQNAREAARRSQCYGNLYWVRYALQNYHDAFGNLPPVLVTDADGQPMHSWRVLLMDHGGKLPTYRFDEGWNSPNNRKLERTCSTTFACPSDPESRGLNRTNFVAVVGENTLWPPSGTRDLGNLQESRDRYADKILLIELPDSDIHWMEPRDITFDEAVALFSAPNGLQAKRHHRDALWCKPPEGLHFITYGGHWKRMESIRDAQHFAELLQFEPTPTREQGDRPSQKSR